MGNVIWTTEYHITVMMTLTVKIREGSIHRTYVMSATWGIATELTKSVTKDIVIVLSAMME